MSMSTAQDQSNVVRLQIEVNEGMLHIGVHDDAAELPARSRR